MARHALITYHKLYVHNLDQGVRRVALFSQTEYESRLHRVKDRMAHDGLDALIIADPANMNYLTGYDGWSFYVPQVVIVAQTRTEPLWIGRLQDSNGARLTCWISESSIKPYPDLYVQSTVRHPMDYVAQVLHEEHLDQGKIGLEMDAYYFTAASYVHLKDQLSRATLVDATLLVNWIRIVKSSQELEYIRQAGKLVTQAMQTAMTVIRPGIREADAAATIMHAQIAGVQDISGDYPAIVPLMPSNERTGAAHLTWTDRRYQTGDALNIEIAGCVHRYHAPLSRSAVIGEPSSKLTELAKVVVEGVNTALSAVRPGLTCGEVADAWTKTIERYGYSKESRLGYSVGLNYPPDWGEHTASLRAGDPTILQPNMVFHLIAGMWLDGYGLEVSEGFVVTPTGCEVLANIDRQLFVIND